MTREAHAAIIHHDFEHEVPRYVQICRSSSRSVLHDSLGSCAWQDQNAFVLNLGLSTRYNDTATAFWTPVGAPEKARGACRGTRDASSEPEFARGI